MSSHIRNTQIISWRRGTVPVLLVIAMVVALFAMIFGVGNLEAQTGDPVNFDNCATATGNNATVAIPSTAPVMHVDGNFTPASGDEFAVYRPLNNSCTGFYTETLCAGATVWQETNDALTVWGDDTQTVETDGMLSGEEMCWRVWDSSTNQLYTATVTYSTDSSGNGTYQANGFYALETLQPSAVNIVAGITDSGMTTSAFLAIGIMLTMATAFVTVRHRRH